MPVYVGVDFHVKTQTVCWMDTADGEIHQRTLDHQREDVARFYGQWVAPVTVGVEASGYAQWFHRLVEERGHRLLVGDAHAIRQFARRRQKNDRAGGTGLEGCPILFGFDFLKRVGHRV